MRIHFLMMFSLCVFSCGNRDKVPANVLTKEKMEKILWDMIQADRFSAQFILKDSMTKNVHQETLKQYEKVFQVHNTSKDQFVKSYKYYLTRPDLIKIMVDSLAAKANRQRPDVYQSR